MTDLLFEFPTQTNGDLLFGGTIGPPLVVHHEATLAATLPAMSFLALAIPDTKATLVVAALPAMSMVATLQYKSYASRPTVSKAATVWQPAAVVETGVKDGYQKPIFNESGSESGFDTAVAGAAATSAKHKTTLRMAQGTEHRQANAVPTAPSGHGFTHGDALRNVRETLTFRYENAVPSRFRRSAGHQDCLRDRRMYRGSTYQEAAKTGLPHAFGNYNGDYLSHVRSVRWQEAKKPPAGIYIAVVVPPGELSGCYTPSGDLVFKTAFDGLGDLTFVCDNKTTPVTPVGQIVVPVRKVYMQVNTQSLVVVGTNQVIEAPGLSLSIDADSWAWGWSATVSADYLDLLQTDLGSAVELIATLNGTPFNLFVERIQRDRSFGKATLNISGRGRAAWLGAPYHKVSTRTNTIDRTAQQLMADALTINGVSNGWAVDWQITDWLVTSGAWSHTGTPMDACLAIAQAAGAYIQADRTANILHVLPRYPSAPWGWGAITPDIVLPDDACVTEGIEWQDKPAYNSVYVSGEVGGVLAYVKKAGTDGGTDAPMVVDPLITHSDAARQKGLSILAAGGRSKVITLQLPLLAETGIILPGKTIQYSENGVNHIGITRAVTVSSSFPKIRQSISVESHVL